MIFEKNVHLDPEDLFSEVLKVVECGLGSYAVHQHEALNNNKNVNNAHKQSLETQEQDMRRIPRFLAPPPPPSTLAINIYLYTERRKTKSNGEPIMHVLSRGSAGIDKSQFQ